MHDAGLAHKRKCGDKVRQSSPEGRIIDRDDSRILYAELPVITSKSAGRLFECDFLAGPFPRAYIPDNTGVTGSLPVTEGVQGVKVAGDVIALPAEIFNRHLIGRPRREFSRRRPEETFRDETLRYIICRRFVRGGIPDNPGNRKKGRQNHTSDGQPFQKQLLKRVNRKIKFWFVQAAVRLHDSYSPSNGYTT